MEFLHIGVPTRQVHPNETYVEGMKLYITSPDEHAMKFEYLRFEPGSWLPAIMQVNPHVAVKVESIAAELALCDEVLVEPLENSPTTRIAFGMRDGVILEFMEETA